LSSKFERYAGNVGACQGGLWKTTKTHCRQPTIHTSEIKTRQVQNTRVQQTGRYDVAVPYRNIHQHHALHRHRYSNLLHKCF